MKSKSRLSMLLLLICTALFSEQITGTACARKLRSTGERWKSNGRATQARKLNSNYESAEEFIPESTLYGIVPILQDAQYGYIPWQRPYKYYNAEENSVYQVTHNWDYGSSNAYYFNDDVKMLEDGVGGNYTTIFYHNDRLIELNGPGVFDCRVKKAETYYNQNYTEYWEATYNDQNGAYNWYKTPPRDTYGVEDLESLANGRVGVEVDSTGNLIILGTLMCIPLSIIVTCLVGCCVCRREHVTERGRHYATPIGEPRKMSQKQITQKENAQKPAASKVPAAVMPKNKDPKPLKVLLTPPPALELSSAPNFPRRDFSAADDSTREQLFNEQS